MMQQAMGQKNQPVSNIYSLQSAPHPAYNYVPKTAQNAKRGSLPLNIPTNKKNDDEVLKQFKNKLL